MDLRKALRYKDTIIDGKVTGFYETYLEENPSSRDYGEIMVK